MFEELWYILFSLVSELVSGKKDPDKKPHQGSGLWLRSGGGVLEPSELKAQY